MGFPSELDGYLDRSLLQHNFDFEAVSADLMVCGSGFIRHPYMDEPDDMVQQRAEATFSPSALRAHWEARYGSWEAPAGADLESRYGPWEVVPEDGWVMVFEATPLPIVHSCVAAGNAPPQPGLGAAGAGKQGVASRGAFYASTDYIADGKLAEIFWEDPMSESTDEGSAEEEEERSFFAGQRRQAKVLPVIVQLAFT